MTNNVYANQADELEMGRQRAAARGVEFFHIEQGDAQGAFSRGWYWTDEYCEEPMGPFPTRAEAEADCSELRGLDASVLRDGGSND